MPAHRMAARIKYINVSKALRTVPGTVTLYHKSILKFLRGLAGKTPFNVT